MTDKTSAALEGLEQGYGIVFPADLRNAWLEGRVPEVEAWLDTGDGKVAGWITSFTPVVASTGRRLQSYAGDLAAQSRAGGLPVRFLTVAHLSHLHRVVISLRGPDSGRLFCSRGTTGLDSASGHHGSLLPIAPDFSRFLAMLRTGFDALRAAFPELGGEFAPPWGLPVEEDFARIHARYGLRYPEAFVRFQTHEAARLPSFPEGFRWANAGLEPYASLEDLIETTRMLDLPDFVPFAEDNGVLFGLRACGAVVSLDPIETTQIEEAPDFVGWLRRQYQRHLQRHGSAPAHEH